ncbi:MAG: zinc-ribbon domain-containing protein [Chloroflexota bacterium]
MADSGAGALTSVLGEGEDEMDIHTWTTIGAIWLLCAVVSGIAAGEKGRRFWVWFPFGLLVGPVALYLVLRSYEVVPAHLAQTCPNCQKSIRKTARECPRCGHILIREPDPVMKAGRQAAAAVFLLRQAARKSTAVVKAERSKRQRAKSKEGET